MKRIIDINNFVNERYLKKYFDKLYRIPRSILGKGFRDSLAIIGEIVDIDLVKVKSGSKVLDWTVPSEWNIKEAYIITPSGKKIADFKKNNLHVLGYSKNINKIMSFNVLKKNIYFLKKKFILNIVNFFLILSI